MLDPHPLAVAQKTGIPNCPGKWKHGPKPAVCPSCLILSHTHFWLENRTPAKNIFVFVFAWLVENQGDPKKAKKETGERILGKQCETGSVSRAIACAEKCGNEPSYFGPHNGHFTSWMVFEMGHSISQGRLHLAPARAMRSKKWSTGWLPHFLSSWT